MLFKGVGRRNLGYFHWKGAEPQFTGNWKNNWKNITRIRKEFCGLHDFMWRDWRNFKIKARQVFRIIVLTIRKIRRKIGRIAVQIFLSDRTKAPPPLISPLYFYLLLENFFRIIFTFSFFSLTHFTCSNLWCHVPDRYPSHKNHKFHN